VPCSADAKCNNKEIYYQEEDEKATKHSPRNPIHLQCQGLIYDYYFDNRALQANVN